MADKPEPESTGLVKKMPIALQDRMDQWFSENASMGEGDLRAAVTLEALQRTEIRDTWTINRRKMNRNAVMELLLDMVASGFSLPAILHLPGMPKARTVMSWLEDYKQFRELMDVADKMYAMQKAHEAEMILESSDDPKQAFRDKAKSDLRMKLAEVTNPRRFGKKTQVDVQHHMDDLSSPEVWSRFRSILISHQAMIQENTGIKIEVPIQEAEIVPNEEQEEPKEQDVQTIGMQGELPASGEGEEE